ncbi:MAG: hypothetical protein KAI47_14050 [Deltaproteobacteria bacterium]|nr:hypothetical protein [Deltaproteobacteria bacterium]
MSDHEDEQGEPHSDQRDPDDPQRSEHDEQAGGRRETLVVLAGKNAKSLWDTVKQVFGLDELFITYGAKMREWEDVLFSPNASVHPGFSVDWSETPPRVDLHIEAVGEGPSKASLPTVEKQRERNDVVRWLEVLRGRGFGLPGKRSELSFVGDQILSACANKDAPQSKGELQRSIFDDGLSDLLKRMRRSRIDSDLAFYQKAYELVSQPSPNRPNETAEQRQDRHMTQRRALINFAKRAVESLELGGQLDRSELTKEYLLAMSSVASLRLPLLHDELDRFVKAETTGWADPQIRAPVRPVQGWATRNDWTAENIDALTSVRNEEMSEDRSKLSLAERVRRVDTFFRHMKVVRAFGAEKDSNWKVSWVDFAPLHGEIETTSQEVTRAGEPSVGVVDLEREREILAFRNWMTATAREDHLLSFGDAAEQRRLADRLATLSVDQFDRYDAEEAKATRSELETQEMFFRHTLFSRRVTKSLKKSLKKLLNSLWLGQTGAKADTPYERHLLVDLAQKAAKVVRLGGTLPFEDMNETELAATVKELREAAAELIKRIARLQEIYEMSSS